MGKILNDLPSSLEDVLKASTPTVKGRDVQHRRYSRFIKGPIPLDWLFSAARLSESALKVGLILWYLAGLKKCKTVKLSNRYLGDFGLSRNGKYRGLAALENAGLVTHSQENGRSPMITICDSDFLA